MNCGKETNQTTEDKLTPANSGGSFSTDDIERLSSFVAVLIQIDQRMKRKEVNTDGIQQKSAR